MMSETIVNPVSGERVTFLQTSTGTGGATTVGLLEVDGGGGVPGHTHDAHEERIEVLEGTIEVTLNGVTSKLHAGEHVVIPKGKIHSWRNPSPDRPLKFRGSMTPGHPGFETALRVLFGLARDGQVRRSGLPRRLGDVALIADWNQGLLVGPFRVFKPIFNWAARRAKRRGRAAELLRLYDVESASIGGSARS